MIGRKRTLRYLLPMLVLLLGQGVVESRAQDVSSPNQPVRPSLDLTSQRNPRGADIVEPAQALKVTHLSTGRADTTYLGTAKIPDPRRAEEGAHVNRDLETGSMVRIGDAWIYATGGHRQIVQFDPTGNDEIVFVNGPHDVVQSRQGVAPRAQDPGYHSIYDLRDLYEGAYSAPMAGVAPAAEGNSPRIALLRMKSTYPGGEAVDLAVILAPERAPAPPAMQAITVTQRDTILLSPTYEIVINRPQEVVRDLAALVFVESGYGGSFTNSAVPATIIPPFSSNGQASEVYVDAELQLRQGQNRWILHGFGMSSVTATDLVSIDHHQVSVYADARFESGARNFILAQVSAQLRDKQYQEFDWNSADYSGSMLVGYGHRKLAWNGVESRRIHLLLGMRMGENRPIEIMETRSRSRGIGPVLSLGGALAKVKSSGVEFHVGTDVTGYSITGRGHRDTGFGEKGLMLRSEVEVGYELRGTYVYGGIHLIASSIRAEYTSGGDYTERKAMLAPGLGVQMRL